MKLSRKIFAFFMTISFVNLGTALADEMYLLTLGYHW